MLRSLRNSNKKKTLCIFYQITITRNKVSMFLCTANVLLFTGYVPVSGIAEYYYGTKCTACDSHIQWHYYKPKKM